MSRILRFVLAASVSAVALVLVASPTGASADRSSSQAVLAGRLGYEGGPYPGGFHPTAGTVEVEFANLPIVLVHEVGKSGHFRFTLSSGTYTVIGCGPSSSGGTSSPCSRPKTIKLRPGEVDHVRLVWAYAPRAATFAIRSVK